MVHKQNQWKGSDASSIEGKESKGRIHRKKKKRATTRPPSITKTNNDFDKGKGGEAGEGIVRGAMKLKGTHRRWWASCSLVAKKKVSRCLTLA